MEIADIKRLSMPDAQAFIREHQGDDPHELVLSWRGRTDLPLGAVAEQIRCRKKARQKLPSFAQTGFLFEETALSQSTGDAAARFKQTLIKGRRLIDCTGGLGIDTLFLRENFSEVVYCERSDFLRELFRQNSMAARTDNITISDRECVQTLLSVGENSFDWAYIDPSRRDSSRRFVGLQQCEPNLNEIESLLVEKAETVCVKASPALEISEAAKSLKTLRSVAVVSVAGECKELLLFMSKSGLRQTPSVQAYVLDDEGNIRFTIRRKSENSRHPTAFGSYFYEPDPALIKAEVVGEVAHVFGFWFVHEQSFYLSADRYDDTFPGRCFEIITVLDWNRKTLKRYLREREIRKAHVSRRWFPLSVDQIRSRFSLLDGGDDYFFFTECAGGKNAVVHCRKCTTGGEKNNSIKLNETGLIK